MERTWLVSGRLFGVKKQFGVQDPPENTPDGCKAHMKRIMPDFEFEGAVPHPGGIAVAKQIVDGAALAGKGVKAPSEIITSL